MTDRARRGIDRRRARHPGEVPVPAAGTGTDGRPTIQQTDGLWRIRSLSAARQVLRARHQTTQAGFTAEKIPADTSWIGLEHRPILISDGPLHDEQRSEVARFFAPTVVQERYLELMERVAARRVAQAMGTRGLAVDELALHYAVEVTAEVVGLTHERPGEDPAGRERRLARMSARLESFFDQPPFDITRDDLGRTRREWAQAARRALLPILKFWWSDVRPALAERRRRPREDVMSHLIGLGWSAPNLLVEAVTYGTAGMVTTREFICMALWHLLSDDDLRDDYLAGDREHRLAVLYEVIRLEPVVGHLYRRTTAPVTVLADGREQVLEAGCLVDIDVRAANADPAAVGDEPLGLCPGRTTARGVTAAGLAFGDGAHKCPGQALAMLETEVLVSRILAQGPRLVAEPTVAWDELVAGYQVRGMRLDWG